jgi:alkaline phosphatase D
VLSGATAPASARRSSAFVHGVASGDPYPDSVLLWTRVTPTAAATPGSGQGPSVVVRWEVAKDRRFRHVVRHGTFRTGPSRDHTVKLVVGGLKPETWYYYRFHLHKHSSRVGRTRTAPPVNSTPDHVRLGVVSCANLQAGWFSAYRGLVQRDDLHAVVHLGDYIYEYGPGEYGNGPDDIDIRPHVPAHEIISLTDYRQRHAQYKQDPDVQDLHAKYPWVVTWDDHEVADDQWSGGAVNHNPGDGDYATRRMQAHRAYDEWMPVRMNGTARLGDGDRLFRRIQFGRLAELTMLDLRSYRSEQVKTAAPTPVPAAEAAVSDPGRTLTGAQQMDFLKQSLSNNRVQWKVIGNPVMIAPVNFGAVPQQLLSPVNDVTHLLPADGFPYNVDQWDGYTADRHEVFKHIRNHQVNDALFITGDIHSGWAAELPYDASTYPNGDSAGVEFVCSSITSNNLKDILHAPPRTASLAVEAAITANNRHVKYLDFDSHGFCVLDLTSQRAQMDWFVIGDRADRNTAITWSRSFRTLAGTGRVTEAGSPVGS